ncbi:MAG: hypothetical protein AAGG75_01335 [Bacteroidota bacterium]
MKRWNKIVSVILLSLSLSLVSVELPAQCPMCRISAESNLKAGGSAGKGLNKGILYMLAMPYLLVGTIGVIWWRNRRREDEFEMEDLIEDIQ